jgi:hypothetical protein
MYTIEAIPYHKGQTVVCIKEYKISKREWFKPNKEYMIGFVNDCMYDKNFSLHSGLFVNVICVYNVLSKTFRLNEFNEHFKTRVELRNMRIDSIIK